MRESLRRFRYPAVYVLLAALCVSSTVSGRGLRDLGVASRLVLALTLPIERMVTLPVARIRQGWRELAALASAREENAELRERLAALREENLVYRETLVASERYQRLRSFRASREVSMVPANVVSRDVSPWFQSIVIDRGAGDGLQAGMPVVTDSGVVGMVMGTAPRASKVLLLIDPRSRIDAYVQRSRARGSVRGTASRGADFEHVLREEDVREGDLLLTSGLDSIYPKGLVVGEVGRTERKPYGLFQQARVAPAVDFRKLEEVFVILERRRLPSDEAFAQSGESLWSAAPP